MTDEQLTNPEAQPNPLIRQLIDVGHELYRQLLDTTDRPLEVTLCYDSANRSVLAAIAFLCAAKNAMAVDSLLPPLPDKKGANVIEKDHEKDVGV